MSNLLREELIEAVELIIQEFSEGTTVVLIDPDGKKYTQSFADPTRTLTGVIQNESREVDGEGFETMVQRPVLTLQLKDLERVPEERKGWFVRIPTSPTDDTLRSYLLAGPPKPFASLGFINLKLQRTKQI